MKIILSATVRVLLLFTFSIRSVYCFAQPDSFNAAKNVYETKNQNSASRNFNPASALSININCSANKFWTVESPNGTIREWQLSGNTITFLDTLFTTSPLISLAYCNLLDTGSIPSTFYGNAFNSVYYFSGSAWTTITSPAGLANAGGHGRFLYFMGNGNTSLSRFDGTTFTPIFTLQGTRFGCADLAVDKYGNAWSLQAQDTLCDSLIVIDSTGSIIRTYTLSPAIDVNNAYGCFLIDSVFYIGIGSVNAAYPNTIIPIAITGASTTSVGFPLPFVNADFYDMESCNGLTGLPSALFSSSDTAFCDESGKCIHFFDQSTDNPTSWQWLFPGAIPDSSTLQNPDSICYYVPGTYPVTLIVSNAAGSDTLTVSPMITVGVAPASPTLSVSNDTIFSTHAATYQWYFNGAPIVGATDSFYVVTTIGTYAVMISDGNGCSVLSGGMVITLTNQLTVHNSQFAIYPNPAADEFIIDGLQFTGGATLEIYNALGEKIYSSQLQPPTSKPQIINCKSFQSGIYFLRITDNAGLLAMLKLVIE